MEKKSFWQTCSEIVTNKWALPVLALLGILTFILSLSIGGRFLFDWNALFASSLVVGLTIFSGIYILPLIGIILFDRAEQNKTAGSFAFFVYLFAMVLLIAAVPLANEFTGQNQVFGFDLTFSALWLLVGLIIVMRPVMEGTRFSVRDISEIAVMVALALVLDKLVKIDINIGAGSLNLGMIPLFLIAFRHRFSKSWLAIGVIFGLISCLLDGWGLYTFPFDYFLAYGSISFVAFFSKIAFPHNGAKANWKNILFFCLAVVVGTFGRYIGSTISSIVIYGTTLSGGLAYNWYIWASGGLALVVLLLLYQPFVIIRRIYPSEN